MAGLEMALQVYSASRYRYKDNLMISTKKFVYCLYSKGFKEGNFTDLPQKGRVGGCPFQDLDDGSGKQVGSLMQYFSLAQFFTYQHHSGQKLQLNERKKIEKI